MAATLAAIGVQSQEPDTVVESLAPYRPKESVSGIIRIWGHGSWEEGFVEGLVGRWERGFSRHHQGIRFENTLRGTANAIGGLYAGVADIALLGREIRPTETVAFEKVLNYPPLGIEVMTGSLDWPHKDFALVVFVHRENPISRMTLAEVDAIFGCEHRRGPRNIRTWGELGLKGGWDDKPIRLYGWPIRRGFGVFFQEVVLMGSHRWNPALQESSRVVAPDGSVLIEDGQLSLDALARDRFGIAYSSLCYMNPEVKPLALAVENDETFFEPTTSNVMRRAYPLTRVITAFINGTPSAPIEPRIQEFFRYILSREGQRDVVADGGYLPLTPGIAREQLQKLR